MGSVYLKTTITRLRPHRVSFLEALEAWKSGAVSLCADYLEGSRAPKAIFLRSRCLFRLGRAKEALCDLVDLDADDLSPEHACQLIVLRSNALHITKQWDRAEEQEKHALNTCRLIANSAMRFEVLFYKAASLLLRSEMSQLDLLIDEADAVCRETSSGYDTESYPFSLGNWRARMYDLAGVSAALRGDHEARISRSSAAISVAARCGLRDDYLELCMLGNYADAGRMSSSESFVRFGTSRLQKFQPSPDLIQHLSTVYFNLAECASNDGEHGEALRLLRMSTDLAPAGPLRLRSLLARVDLLHESGETLGSRDLLEQAMLYNETLDWTAEINARRVRLLLYLASRIAHVDPLQADRLLDTYHTLAHRNDGIAWINIDTGESAEEQVALAQIALSRGHVGEALEHFRAALARCERIGYKAQIAATSFEIWKITREEVALETARRWTGKHPRSLLARKMTEFSTAASV